MPLWQHVLTSHRLYRPLGPINGHGQPRAGAARARRREARADGGTAGQIPQPAARRRSRPRTAGPGGGERDARPGRRDQQLDSEGLLPAIIFTFSRAGCDAAVQQCLRAGLRLIDLDARAEIDGNSSKSALRDPGRRGPATCSATGSGSRGSSAGSPPTTPACCPVFKEVVEELFVRGLVTGRLRHRDARARHQHAGPVRRAWTSLSEVERRDPRRHHAGGVHPAHPAGPAAAASTSRATPSSSGQPGGAA